MSQTRQPILNGKKDICRYVGRSLEHDPQMDRSKGFPGTKAGRDMGSRRGANHPVAPKADRGAGEGRDSAKKINPKDWGQLYTLFQLTTILHVEFVRLV